LPYLNELNQIRVRVGCEWMRFVESFVQPANDFL
jgi:hypothetical protein